MWGNRNLCAKHKFDIQYTQIWGCYKNRKNKKVLFSLNASGAKIRFWIGDSTCDQRVETGLYGRSLIVLCTAVLFGFGQSPTILIVKRQRSEMTILFRTESNYSNSEKTKVWNGPFSSTRNISWAVTQNDRSATVGARTFCERNRRKTWWGYKESNPEFRIASNWN